MTIAFLDFETTGLDPDIHEPIELAVVVVDDSFQELASGEWLIRPRNWRVEWDAPAREMHNRSGLARLAEDTGEGFATVALKLERFLTPFADRGSLHLAGNSVHFDRGFLREYMPRVDKLLHHRHLDVSSVRMLAERVVPNAPQLPGEKPHRAMADVRRSIAELHHWTRILRGTP